MKIDLEALFSRYGSDPKTDGPQLVEVITPLQQAIGNIKKVFPGTKILSAEEIQKMNAKGYFDPSEWAQARLSKEGSE